MNENHPVAPSVFATPNVAARRHPSRFNAQSGWTFWSLLFVMGVMLFTAYVGMQLVPVYSSNENIKNAMENAIADKNLLRINRNSIVKGMKAQLFLDGNNKVINYATDVTVERSERQFIFTTSYEREVPLFFNLSLLVRFDNVIERDLSAQ